MDVQTIKQAADLAAIIERSLGPGRRVGRSLLWLCPWHDDGHNPSLSLKPGNGSAADYYHCFGCGKSGDVITWLMDHDGLTFRQAVEFLGGNFTSDHVRREAPLPTSKQAPAADWQAAAQEITTQCKQALCSPIGDRARHWLNARGLKDNTICTWDLGYSRGETIAGIYVEPGIVIPGHDGERYWYIKIRRSNGSPKYRKVRGSSNGYFGQPPHLYWSNDIFLTEGEFDCMLLWQECYEITNVATFGSASDRIDPATWGGPLSFFDKIYAVYDLDAAGSAAAFSLFKLTGRAVICKLPKQVGKIPVKDITDYYLAGGDLQAWAWYQIRGGAG